MKKAYGKIIEISLSEQKTATDIIAVDLKNDPFRKDDGSLLFRPAGHGALLENLNEIDADLIFIKNIDNISIDRYPSETIEHKKILGGKLIEVQAKVFSLLKELETTCSEQRLMRDESMGA